jgi:hypothetical protein
MNQCYHVKIGVTIAYPDIASTTHCKFGNSHISTKYSSVLVGNSGEMIHLCLLCVIVSKNASKYIRKVILLDVATDKNVCCCCVCCNFSYRPRINFILRTKEPTFDA